MKHSRWFAFLPLMAFVTMNYMDRINLSVAAPVMAHQLHLSPAQLGAVFGSFGFGYLLMGPLAGWLTDVSLKRFVVASVIAWGVISLATAFVTGFAELLVLRILLGISEIMLPVAVAKIVVNWLLPSERGIGYTVGGAWALIGATVAAPLVAWLLPAITWRGVFVVFALITGVTAVINWVYLEESPRSSRRVSQSECQFILSQQEALSSRTADARPRLAARREVYRNPWTWTMLLVHFGTLSIFFANLSWLPSYLVTTRHLNLHSVGYLSALIFLSSFVITILLGWFSDRTHLRAPIILGSLVAAVVCMVLSLTAGSLSAVVVLLCLTMGFSFGSGMLVWTLPMELMDPGYLGTAGGVITSGGNISSIVGPFLVGYLVGTTHSFTPGLMIVAGFSLVGVVALIPLVFLERRVRLAARSAVPSGEQVPGMS